MNPRKPAAILAAVSAALFCLTATAQQPASNLDGLRARYEAHRELVLRPLAELGDKYLMALMDLQVVTQKNADLDGLVAVKKEIERFGIARSPASAFSEVDAVARLQRIFAAQHRATRADLKDELVALHDAFRNQLKQLMVRLTTAGNADEALKVHAALEQLSSDPEGNPTLESGLVLHLVFESEKGDLVRDASGNGNHGRLIGDAKNHSTGENRGSYAVLDGRGDFIECAHADSLSLTTDGSISFWVRPKRLQSMRGLVSKYNPTKAYTLRTWKEGQHRKVAFGGTNDNFVSKTELRDKRWSHVVMTLEKGTVRFYFDGKLDSEGQRSAPLNTNTDPLRIGNDYDGRYFMGAIDDVRIYNRPLSAEEVAELFRVES